MHNRKEPSFLKKIIGAQHGEMLGLLNARSRNSLDTYVVHRVLDLSSVLILW
jgi:hypothetical protein